MVPRGSKSQGGENQHEKQFSLPLKEGKTRHLGICDTVVEKGREARFSLKSTFVELQAVSFAILDLYDLRHTDPEISHLAVKYCLFLQPKHCHLLKTFPYLTIPLNPKPGETAPNYAALEKKSGHRY